MAVEAYAAVPLELRERPQWVCWRAETRDGRATKVPYRFDGKGRARSNDPATWGTFEQACAAVGFDGIGYVLAEDDDFCFIDFDGCFADVAGKKFTEPLEARKARAKEWVERFGSYSEYSPTRTGAHVIVRARILKGRNSQKHGLEIYDRGRFMTMSGQKFSGNGIVEAQAVVDAFCGEFFPAQQDSGTTMGQTQTLSQSGIAGDLSHCPICPTEPREDDDVLERARSETFDKLFDGDTTGYGSHSDADWALCKELAAHTRDPLQIERIFGRSKLAQRAKWGRADYRRSTIEKALLDTPVNAEPTWSGPAPALAQETDLLARFARDIRTAGVAGEEAVTQLLFLQITSRLLAGSEEDDRPVSTIPKGTSSSGKSYAAKKTIAFFPPHAVINLGAITKRHLFYEADEHPERFKHSILYVPEYTTIENDEELISLLRSLISDGSAHLGTVEGDGKKRSRTLTVEGPMGVLITTTRARADAELETRCLSPRTDDTPQQTRRVFRSFEQRERRKLGLEPGQAPVDFDAWHKLQLWLASQDNRTHVPFLGALAEAMPAGDTRLRRDFGSLLCLIRAHTLLHRETRKTTNGYVVATGADYEAVRKITDALFAESANALAPAAIRETVEVIAQLNAEGDNHTTVRAVGEKLGIGHNAAFSRIKRALSAGYLVNEAPERKPYKLKVGAALPEEVEFLPTLEELRAIPVPPWDRQDSGTEGAQSPSQSGFASVPSENKVNRTDGTLDLGTASLGELKRHYSEPDG